jgi:hypothetical protein
LWRAEQEDHVQRGFHSRLAIIGLITVGVQLVGFFDTVVALAAPEPAKASAATTGYDVSYPQCSSRLPNKPAFAIVGVNGGLAYSGNSCLAAEYQWAATSTATNQAHVSFYVNTGNPGPTASTHWPPAGTTTPQSCDGSWSQSCAYDYGWNAAQDSFSRAVPVAGASAAVAAPWWLDVETANSWSTDTATNRADLQGAIAALRSAGVSSIGIYSTASMWSQITGATAPNSVVNDPFRALPNWVPGARNAKEAPSLCSRTFAGGPVKFVQYPTAGFDGDYACF